MSEIHSDKPINFDPWSRIYLNIDVPQVIKGNGIYEIHEDKIYLIETSKNWIYYLIEKRNFIGYDESLKEVMISDGIFIYKINERVIYKKLELNHVNRSENNMGIQFLRKEVLKIQEEINLKVIDSNHLSIEKRKIN